MTRLVGIDLSLTRTGVAVVDSGALVSVHAVSTSPCKDAKGIEDTLARHDYIAGRIVEFSAGATFVAIESPAFGARFGASHERAGLYWKVIEALSDRTIVQIPPKVRAKYATGSGNADKATVLSHVAPRYSVGGIEIPNHDIADAVVIAAIAARALNMPIEREELATDNLAAMRSVDIPLPFG